MLIATNYSQFAPKCCCCEGTHARKPCQGKASKKGRRRRQISFFGNEFTLGYRSEGDRSSQRRTPLPYTSSKSSLANSALSEMKANRASALVPIRRSTESAVPALASANSTTRIAQMEGRAEKAMGDDGQRPLAYHVEIVDY